MKTVFLFLLSVMFLHSACGQTGEYSITATDTITLPSLSLRKTAALHAEGAILFMDFSLFKDYLRAERNGLKKKIRSLERIINHQPGSSPVMAYQLKSCKRQYALVDSVFSMVRQGSHDTLSVYLSDFYKLGSPFGYFLPSLIENKRCTVSGPDKHPVDFIIKQSGFRKTGQMSGEGSSYYFLPGAKKHFWSKMDWVS